MSARLNNWDDLQLFLATARAGTLAGAAQELGINSSTVHRRMARLEEDLATRLFERSQRGYALTPIGEELFRSASRMEEEAEAIQRKIHGHDRRLEGLVRVSTVDDLAAYELSPLLAEFRKKHPGVTLEVDIRTSFSDLDRGQADVALRFGRRPTDGSIIAKHIAWTDVALYANRDYLARSAPLSCIEDLRHHDIVRGAPHMAKLNMEELLDRYADPKRIALRSQSMLTRLAAVRDGIGVGFLACLVARKATDLVPIPLAGPRLGGDLWMLIHADLRTNARVRAFVDHVFPALIARTPYYQLGM